VSSELAEPRPGPDTAAAERAHHELEEGDELDTGDGCELVLLELLELEVDDDDVDALVLYADVDPTDQAALEARRLEWQELLS
jgi:hypothetical protein